MKCSVSAVGHTQGWPDTNVPIACAVPAAVSRPVDGTRISAWWISPPSSAARAISPNATTANSSTTGSCQRASLAARRHCQSASQATKPVISMNTNARSAASSCARMARGAMSDRSCTTASAALPDR